MALRSTRLFYWLTFVHRWRVLASAADPWYVEGTQFQLLLPPHPGPGHWEFCAVGEGGAKGRKDVCGSARSQDEPHPGCRSPGSPSFGRLHRWVGEIQLRSWEWHPVVRKRSGHLRDIRGVQTLEWLRSPPPHRKRCGQALEDAFPQGHVPIGGCGELVLWTQPPVAV